jgi:hypothetical protein
MWGRLETVISACCDAAIMVDDDVALRGRPSD